MKLYSKYIFFLFCLFLFFWISLAFDTSWCIAQNFVVTAYYSPETGQAFYYKSSYEDEKILNGEWYCWASWKKVFNGMLAWPSSYNFWTIIYFPALWVWEIADRGWAIVEAWERWHAYDRIDIRMGKWEEWLIRALVFGKKTLSWYLCTGSTNPPNPPLSSRAGFPSVSRGPIGLDFDSVPILKNFFDLSVWIQQLSSWRNDVRTWTLQKYLVKLWYLNKKYQNWIYDTHTKRAVCNYQVKKWIIARKNKDCGNFGSATRYIMKLDVQNKNLLPEKLWETTTFDAIVKQAENCLSSKSPSKGDFKSTPNASFVQEGNKLTVFQFYRAYTKNQKSSEIEILQKFLQSEKLFSGKLDGIYSAKVMSAVFSFQKKYGILSDKSDVVLKWYLGPSTRKKMNEIRNK